MSLDILTTVWGTKHLDWFRKGTLKSLAFKKNRASLYEHKARWNIFTDEKDIDFVRKLVAAQFDELEINVQPTYLLRSDNDPLRAAFIWQLEECLRHGKKLLLAPPDTIFGDGAVGSLLSVGRERGSCVAVPHPRANPTIFDDIDGNLSNPELVSLTWKHLHRSWLNARVGHPNRNSYIGGVYWDSIGPNTFSVVHRLPTIYLADFTTEDLKFFKSQNSFGVFDHVWPGQLLIPRGRQRTIGSSDAGFIIEVTDLDKNIPPMAPGNPDDFWQKNPHNEINRQFVSIFRGVS